MNAFDYNTIKDPEKEKVFKMKKWLVIFIGLGLLLTIPSLYERWTAEWNNRTYEFIISYEDMEELSEQDPKLDVGDILHELKNAGLHSVSLEPDTLATLERKGIITLADHEEMIAAELLKGKRPIHFPKGIYIYPHDELFLKKIQSRFETLEPRVINGNTFYFIEGKKELLVKEPIAYDPSAVKAIKDQHLHLIPRVPSELSDESHLLMREELTELKDEQTEKVLFTGQSVPSYPDRKKMIQTTRQMKELGYVPFAIEFAEQKGFQTVASTMDYDVIRLHSIDLNGNNEKINVDRAIRAVKERNIKALFIHIPKRQVADVSLQEMVSFLNSVRHEMPRIFQPGSSQPFKKVAPPFWQTIFILLAGIAYSSLATLHVLKNRRLAYIMMGFMTALSLGYLLIGMDILAKAFALIVAVIGPIYAVVPKKRIKNMKDILKEYSISILIIFISIWIIIGLLNGNQYFVKIDAFRGVKLLYLLPIVVIVGYALWGRIIKLLRTKVTYWQAALLFIIAVVAFYYISRTGNSGSVSTLELTARQLLEKWLYVRPRTKEFLIGFPFYVLALYVSIKRPVWGLLLLIPGVIGFLSLVNTFTHLHIPLYVSLLRSGYGLLFGFLFGLLFIFLYEKAVHLYDKVKLRWHP